MNNQIDQLFQKARESETPLAKDAFMANLAAELNIERVTSEPRFEWLSIFAVALATLVVFFSTPIFGWILAVPGLLSSTTAIAVLGLSSLVIAMSLYACYELELI